MVSVRVRTCYKKTEEDGLVDSHIRSPLMFVTCVA